MSQSARTSPRTIDFEDEDDVTVHITGPGVAHVDLVELIRSKKVRRLMAKMQEVFEEEKRLRVARGRN